MWFRCICQRLREVKQIRSMIQPTVCLCSDCHQRAGGSEVEDAQVHTIYTVRMNNEDSQHEKERKKRNCKYAN